MIELETKVLKHQVDQGVVDYSFHSVFQVVNREDGRHHEVYQIQIDSLYSDAYDHASQEWGVYSLTHEGTCNPIN